MKKLRHKLMPALLAHILATTQGPLSDSGSSSIEQQVLHLDTHQGQCVHKEFYTFSNFFILGKG